MKKEIEAYGALIIGLILILTPFLLISLGFKGEIFPGMEDYNVIFYLMIK